MCIERNKVLFKLKDPSFILCAIKNIQFLSSIAGEDSLRQVQFALTQHRLGGVYVQVASVSSGKNWIAQLVLQLGLPAILELELVFGTLM